MSGKISDTVAAKLAQESAERQARERDEKLKKAQRLRLDYMLKLNDLGLHENCVLEIGPRGIIPRPQVVPVDPKQQAEVRRGIEEEIAKLSGIHLSGSGIVT